MSLPKVKLRRDTRVFISAASRELGSIRKLVKKGLEDNDFHVVEQDNFPPDYRQLLEKLRERIASCDAVVHIAGRCFGSEPQERPAGVTRRSYTQIEYDIAVELGKPVYVFLTGEGFATDPHEPEDEEKSQLQEAHRQRLAGTGRDYYRPTTWNELDQKIRSLQLKVEALQEELTAVDVRVAATGRRTWRMLGVVIGLVLLTFGVIGSVRWQQASERSRAEQERFAQQQERVRQERERENQETERQAAEAARQQAMKVTQVQQEFADRFLHQLLANQEITAEDARQRALKELPALVELPLEEVRALIDRRIPAATPDTPASALERARQALAQGKYDEVFQAADDERQAGRELAMLEGTAALARFRESPKPQWHGRALSAFDRALALSDRMKEPVAWADMANLKARVLLDLARYGEAESLLVESLTVLEDQQGKDSAGITAALNNLAILLRATNRLEEAEPLMRRALAIDEQFYGPEHPDVAIRLNNLATLLQDTNRLAEAEPLMRRALAIDEQANGVEHPGVAVGLNNLATLLRATNRLEEAEPLIRRALAIDEQAYGAAHPAVAVRLNNLAQLLQDTNRLAEAEPLMRRALAIDEQAYGAAHPAVAVRLNNLAQLLQDTNRLAEAEPLMRRALAIDEQAYGAEHPDVARELDNLARLLMATKRLAEAEPLMRRALAIDEQAYGAEHPDVAIRLNNLALLLKATKRLTQAKPLMRRCVQIYYRFERKTGRQHAAMQQALANYRVVFGNMKLTDDQIAERVKDATAIAEPLSPIAPEVARLLGPAQPVAAVLTALDRQYKSDGKPAIYTLPPDQPMAPQLDQLLKPSYEFLNAAGLAAYRKGEFATAMLNYDEAIKLLADETNNWPASFRTRMNRAAALREMGEVETAQEELRNLISEIKLGDELTALEKGRARYHLALCQWRLGDFDAAVREGNGSLQEYGSDADSVAAKYQTEQLITDLSNRKPPPPSKKIDTAAELEKAQARMQAVSKSARLPLEQPIAPLLDEMLGAAAAPQDVFATLDHKYREQRKPDVWFLPLSEPIAPHLDELLGPQQSIDDGQ